METLEEKANQLGIPMQVQIDDAVRYPECVAHLASLASIEGKFAVYKGECNMRHVYQMRYEIEELQQRAQIVNGELSFGGAKSFQAQPLEEY